MLKDLIRRPVASLIPNRPGILYKPHNNTDVRTPPSFKPTRVTDNSRRY